MITYNMIYMFKRNSGTYADCYLLCKLQMDIVYIYFYIVFTSLSKNTHL